MVQGLRSRLGLFALLAAFLIPISTSQLRGLTKALTCTQEVATPFTLILHEDGPPEVLSSTRIERGAQEGLCGGLLVDLRAGTVNEKISMKVLVTNNTDSPWRGTIHLSLKGQTEALLPVRIGTIPPRQTGQDTVEMSLPPGRSELSGSLLIGP